MLKFSMTYKAISICSIVLLSIALLKLRAETPSKPVKTPVLVELFTSEGCSSCPPADVLLQKLYDNQPVERAEIIILGEHVDYWDELGWHDRFSSRQYTDRQNGYGNRFHLRSVYTPQMVVDGAQEFVGNDASRATRAITQAAQNAKLGLALSTPVFDAGRVSAEVQLVTAGASLPNGDLYAAVVDPLATTDVRTGENGGRQLHHAGVVRSLQKIGSLQDLNGAPVKFSLKTSTDVAPGKERIVVFAQKPGQGAILGVVESAKRL